MARRDEIRHDARMSEILTCLALRAASPRVHNEVLRLAELAGLDVDVHPRRTATAILTLVEADPPTTRVRLDFHPSCAQYFAGAPPEMDVQADGVALIDLFLKVGATQRGTVIGVVGAHGGSGATSVAIWLAHALSARGPTVLIDADPASYGIDLRVGVEAGEGRRWADLQGQGALLPGRLRDALVTWNEVRILSADARARANFSTDLPHRAVAALAQSNAFTVLDVGRSVVLDDGAVAGHEEAGFLRWCDALLICGKPDVVGITALHNLTMCIPEGMRTCHVINGVRARAHRDYVSREVGASVALGIRWVRDMEAQMRRGIPPHRIHHRGLTRDIRALTSWVVGT